MIYLFAGEQSGDLHGANLAKALPGRPLRGVAGPHMRAAGVIGSMQMEQFAVMGITDVIRHLPTLIRLFKEVRDEILNLQPEAVVLIDYAAFNILLAKALRKKGYRGKLIHYICPSVWAHGKGRIKKMASTLDLLLTIFPFEPKYFEGSGLEAYFVGNPVAEAVQNHTYDNQWKEKAGIDPKKPLIALFPGSRKSVVERNLPLQLQSCAHFQPVISCAHPDLLPLIRKLAPGVPTVPSEYRYELMRDSRSALATSGTVTLELALHQRPTVVNYALTTLNRLVFRYIAKLKLPYYCIVNIIAGKEVFPELIKTGSDPKAMASAFETINAESPAREACIQECAKITQTLADQKASLRAAEKIESLLTC